LLVGMILEPSLIKICKI